MERKRFMEWINRLVKKIHPTQQPQLEAEYGKLSPEQLIKIIEMIENSQENETECEKINRLLDQFAELTLQGADADQILPVVKDHLKLCHDCHEEYDALMRILHSQSLK